MRPQGEIRSAICETLRQLGPMPLVDLVQHVNVQTTPAAIEYTVKNAVCAGVLVKAGSVKRAHCNKWVALYDVATNEEIDMPIHDGGMVVLGSAISGWR
jgi:hypothetical protein